MHLPKGIVNCPWYDVLEVLWRLALKGNQATDFGGRWYRYNNASKEEL